MYTVWTKHLKTEEEKTRFTNEMLSSRPVLERLTEILREIEKEDLLKRELDISTYDTASWAYKQAHINGYRACLGILHKLINLDEQKKKD